MRRALLFLPLLLTVLAAPNAAAQVELGPASRIRIEGTSTVNAFTCEAAALEGQGQVAAGDVAGRLRVAVADFDCGHDRINRDFRDAMQAAEHPDIRFELEDATVVTAPEEEGAPYRLRAYGRLTIAGTARAVALELTGWSAADGTLHARGRHALQMTDFGIRPPTALLGLVRTHDRIVVHFDLVAHDTSGAFARTD